MAATAVDIYRKPMPGMWYAVQDLLKQNGVAITKDDAFFVGDAAGRSRDHNSTDKKFADNIGVPFFTPRVRLSIWLVRE